MCEPFLKTHTLTALTLSTRRRTHHGTPDPEDIREGPDGEGRCCEELLVSSSLVQVVSAKACPSPCFSWTSLHPGWWGEHGSSGGSPEPSQMFGVLPVPVHEGARHPSISGCESVGTCYLMFASYAYCSTTRQVLS